MNKGRRRFIQSSLVGGALVGSGLGLGRQPARAAARDAEALALLVLGGTGFIGPHMVREALRRGHKVTLFNRGRTNDELFPDLETLIGDRDNGLDALKGRTWDAVVDNSGYVPRHVHDSASLLSPSVGHYVYISTVSVYASFAKPLNEDSPLATMEDESIEEVTGETYGPLKALCEKRARAALGGDRLTVLRPTYICGPGDRTDRYTYWPVRTMDGGSMLWPGKPTDPIQIIDVRDLANFTIDCVERRHAGIYNTVTPPGEFTIGDLLADSVAVTGAAMNPTWVDDAFIRANGLDEGRKLPIWVSPESESAGGALVSGERALKDGLRNRPTRETARDTVSWWKTLPPERTGKLRAGLTRDEEVKLLEQWRAANS